MDESGIPNLFEGNKVGTSLGWKIAQLDISTFPRKLLWRFLCLYAFGGMYVDLRYSSTSPQTYDDVAKTVLRDSYNTALLWTTAEGYPEALSRSRVQINPFIIAVSPGHPLMYYAVQHVLIEIIPVLLISIALITRPYCRRYK